MIKFTKVSPNLQIFFDIFLIFKKYVTNFAAKIDCHGLLNPLM